MHRSITLLLLLLFLLVATSVQADTAIINWTGPTENQVVTGTLGWGFTVGDSDLTVTHLGLWDEGQDGLLEAHDIGVWDSLESLIYQTTIPTGTTATLVDDYRYVSITDFVLSAGQSYVIGAQYDGSIQELRSTGVTSIETDPALDWDNSRALRTSSLAFPSNVGSGPTSGGYFGPNFQFETQAVPAPTTIVSLIGLGIMLSLTWLRRRRRV